ncbi:MAG: hypothetical protein AMXMBFR33_64560 [Candidatus Xenobia bacterium]
MKRAFLRLRLFAPLLPPAVRVEAARQVGQACDVVLVSELAARLPSLLPEALTGWPEERRHELFELSALNGHLEDFLSSESWRQSAAYAGLEPWRARAVLERFPPDDPAARALLMLLAEEFERYLDFDLSRDSLHQALQRCRPAVRSRALHLLTRTGHPELVRAAVAPVRDWLELEPDEWLPRLEGMARHQSAELFDLLPRLGPEQALAAVEQLRAVEWRAPDRIAPLWAPLRAATLPSWQRLRAELAAPLVLRRERALEQLTLSPCGTRMAWREEQAWNVGILGWSEPAQLARLRGERLSFDPTGEVVGVQDPSGVSFFLVTRPDHPLLLYERRGATDFRHSRTRSATVQRRPEAVRLALWPACTVVGRPDEVDLPLDTTAFVPLDPPGAVVGMQNGSLGIFRANRHDLRWQKRSHPGRVERLEARPASRKYVASCGPEGVVLWRMIELVFSELLEMGRVGPSSCVSFWREQLLVGTTLYQMEPFERSRELVAVPSGCFPAGQWLLAGLSEGGALLFDGAEERVLPGSSPAVQGTAAPDGTLWVVQDGDLMQLDPARRMPRLCLAELAERPEWGLQPRPPALEVLSLLSRAFAVELADGRATGESEIELE